MTQTALKLYHRMPGRVRSLVGSLYGYKMRAWRYGPETEQIVAEALERERWPVDKLRAWQQERLAETLHRAATKVPHYRDAWSRRRQSGDRRSWERIEHWPILEKQTLRDRPEAFLAEDSDPRRLYCDSTSGTTGTPIKLWQSRGMIRMWYGLAEARWRRWYGVRDRDRWAILGGKMVVSPQQKKPPYWIWNQAFQQLYLSSYHVSSETIGAIVGELDRRRIRYLVGYTASLHQLAHAVLERGLRPKRLAFALSNGEPVFEYQRKAVREAFGCELRESYGLSEACVAASECEHGQMHLWPEPGWVEAVRDDEPLPEGETGELLCTSLLNRDMPLIRYRVGDRGALAPHSPCGCGRSLPTIASLEGRIDDVFHMADGRVLSPNTIDIIFQGDLPLREAQIVQKSLEHVRIRYVPAPGFDESASRRMQGYLRERLGPIEISLEELERIPRGPNGKFKVVASEVARGSAL
ncbi:MAG: AMP-binding protein [Bryobacterales bacterium]